MADETSRASEKTSSARSSAKPDVSNVEFLESSLQNPVNVVRATLKQLENLPENVAIRRVVVITEVLTEEGRGLNAVWSEGDHEQPYEVQDSLVSMLTRLKLVLVDSGD